MPAMPCLRRGEACGGSSTGELWAITATGSPGQPEQEPMLVVPGLPSTGSGAGD
jgi:hypothetical protein